MVVARELYQAYPFEGIFVFGWLNSFRIQMSRRSELSLIFRRNRLHRSTRRGRPCQTVYTHPTIRQALSEYSPKSWLSIGSHRHRACIYAPNCSLEHWDFADITLIQLCRVLLQPKTYHHYAQLCCHRSNSLVSCGGGHSLSIERTSKAGKTERTSMERCSFPLSWVTCARHSEDGR